MKLTLSIKPLPAILLIAALTFVFSARAQQSVAINNDGTAPHASALLDVKSTTKGILPPRMTTSQILNISNPAAGLIVFNTTSNQLYQYTPDGWVSILTSNYWSRPINNRDLIYSISDSVGIGVIPTTKFDVNGNARFRNTLRVDEGINGQSLTLSGNTVSLGSALFSSGIQSNTDMVINNASATLQLTTSGTNKAFVQISGNDMRVGTNAGNTTGDFIVRMNGNTNMRIEPSGVINTAGNIHRPEKSGAKGLLPLAYGVVTRDGVLLTSASTSNVTVTRTSEGVYQVVINEPSNALPTVVVTPIWEDYVSGGLTFNSGQNTFPYVKIIRIGPNDIAFTIHMSQFLGGEFAESVARNTRFSFVVWGVNN